MVYENPGLLIVNVQGTVTANPDIMAEVKIDGQLTYLTYGPTSFWLQPGPHRLEFASLGALRHGFASTDVVMPPGWAIELFYAGPLHIFWRRGAIGPVPQQRPGAWAILWAIGIVGVTAVLIALIMDALGI